MKRIVDIVARLRAPDGCAWDRAQDERSMSGYVLEEAHEVVDAIRSGDVGALRDELGDLLFQIVFLAQLATERGEFTLSDVVDSISEKMIRRHPHVWGPDGGPPDPTATAQPGAWEAAKAAERGDRPLLDGIPRSLPALHRARRLTDRAAGVDFEWPNSDGVWDKLTEELAELREAAPRDAVPRPGSPGERPPIDTDAVRHELGDVLFVLVNLGRFLGVDSEDALHRASGRFEDRFGYLERRIIESGGTLDKATLDEMDALWNEAKRQLSERAEG